MTPGPKSGSITPSLMMTPGPMQAAEDHGGGLWKMPMFNSELLR